MAHTAAFRLLGLTLGALVLGDRLAGLRPAQELLLAAGAICGLILARRCRRAWMRIAIALPGCALALTAASVFEVNGRNTAVTQSLQAHLDEGHEGGARIWLGQVSGIPEPDAHGTRIVLRLAGEVIEDRMGVRITPALGRVATLVLTGVKAVPAPYEWWVLRGEILLESGRRNPGGPDRRAWAERRGIAGRLVVAGPTAAYRLCRAPSWHRRPDLGISSFIGRVRGRVHREIAGHFEPEAAGLAEAMALGMRGSLDPDTIAGFRHLGWQHLIAVSGMNVGFVLVLAGALLHLIPLRRSLHTTVLVFLVILYTVLTGSEPPVVRATVMLLLALLARACQRSLSSAQALAVAALFCLAAVPRWLGDPSFQLSFGALGGMALLGPRLDWSHPLLALDGRGWIWRGIVLPLWAGVAAQIGCLPVLASTFHWLSPWGVLTGPLVIPHSALLVSAVLLSLVLLLVIPPLGHLCLGGAATVTEALLAVERLGWHGLPPPWPMSSPGLLVIAAFTGALLLLSVSRKVLWRAGVALVAGATTLVMMAGWPAARGPTVRAEVVFLDVGQGDAALVLAHGAPGWIERLGCRRRPQAVLVIDAGDRRQEGFDAGRAVVAPALAALGARDVDCVILSHADRDHIGGLEALAAAFPVQGIVWSRPLGLTQAVNRLTRADNGIPLRLAARGDTVFARPGLTAIALHPPQDSKGPDPAAEVRGNDGSLVIRISAGGHHVLFTGDIEELGESILCESAQDLAADVIKVPHHGSRTSSTPRLAEAVRPRHAIVSVGDRNRFGHPAPEIVDRWRQTGSWIWRTDSCGAVTAVLEAQGVTVAGTAEGSGLSP